MAERPKNVRRGGSGEAAAAPGAAHGGSWGAIARHRRDSQPKCAECRAFSTAYSREWYRTARSIPTFRERHNEATIASHRRLRDDPDYRAADNAKRRARKRAQLRREDYDRRYGIDEVVVGRLVGGEKVPHNRVERLEAVRQLRARGVAYDQVAALLRVQPRQVHRDITELGLIDPTGAVA